MDRLIKIFTKVNILCLSLLLILVNGKTFDPNNLNIEHKALVKDSQTCNDECISNGAAFCLKKDDKSAGYCCKGREEKDCSDFGKEFGTCSSNTHVRALKY